MTYDSGTDTVESLAHRTYDSFGNLTSEQNENAVDILFGYTGRQFDEATGLQNNLNRWYDPAVGRWISEDPIGFAGWDANLSRYSSNNPINSSDASGLRNEAGGTAEEGSVIYLIMGLGPYPGTPVNNAQDIARKLARELGPCAKFVPIKTSWTQAQTQINNAIVNAHNNAPGRPVVVIGIGSGTPGFELEMTANNSQDGRPTNYKDRPSAPYKNRPGGPDSINSTLPATTIQVHYDKGSDLDGDGTPDVPLNINNQCDTYLCNTTNYEIISQTADGNISSGAFFHVPQNSTAQQEHAFVSGVAAAFGNSDGDGIPNHLDPYPSSDEFPIFLIGH